MSKPHPILWNRPQLTLAMVIGACVIGAILIYWTLVQVDRQMRDDLLAQARLVSKVVNIEQLRALSGTAADLDSPEYQQLKKNLIAIRATDMKFRFVYFTGCKPDGKVFFFVDSEPADSKDYSPPGQIYDEAPQSFLRVFDTKKAAVEGPDTDRWGTWVSAMVPIYDTASRSSGLVTKDEAQVMAGKAIDFYRKNGRELFLKEVNDPMGQFHKGSLYVFVYDLNMTMQAHPVKPELVGQNLLEKKDWPGGKYFRKEIQQVALGQGSGWVDYQYENPTTKKVEPKTTYVEKADDLIICAGAYKGTGELLAVMGLDTDAHNWSWDVAAKAAMPVGLILFLLISLITAFISAQSVALSIKPILGILMPPLTGILVILLAGGGIIGYEQHRQQLANETGLRIDEIASELHIALDQQAFGLNMALQPIVADPGVKKSLREGDAAALLTAWKPMYDVLHQRNRITHFYFFDKNRICLLRVHKPEKKGDRIDRFTAREAERTGNIASGVELGPLGTLTLRVVQPVFDGGTLVGYVELGKGIEDILRALPNKADTQIIAVVHKDRLERKAWEDGLRILGKEGDWDKLARNVVVFASQEHLSDDLMSWIDRFAGSVVHQEKDREIVIAGKTWRIAALPLEDAAGDDVGDILLLHEMSAENAAFMRLTALSTTAGAVVLMMLLAFIYLLLRRTDEGIRAQQAALRASEERLSEILHGVAEWAWEVDDKGIYTYSSPKGEEYFGPIIGKTPFDFMPPDEVKRVGAIFADLAARKAPVKDLENWNIDKHGNRVCLLTNGVPVLDKDGNLKGYRGLDKDITETKILREEDQKHLNELEIFYTASIGREERIIELKNEIQQLKKQLGKNA